MNTRQPALLRFLGLLAALFLLAACSFMQGTDGADGTKDPARSKEEAESELSSNLIVGLGVDPTAEKIVVSSEEELANIDNGSDEELIWTDPDNPEASVAELDAAFENRRKGNGWLSDLNQGMRLARREGRPLILWIHDSVISPKSKELGTALLETPEFLKWCEDRVVCVKLDAGSAIDENSTGKRVSLSTVQSLQRRFGVHKRPALVVFTPQGKIVERVDGYSGYPTEVEIALRNGVMRAETANEEYRERLKPKGYREWHLKRGGTVFAKLMRFDEKKKMVYLKEAGGKVVKVKLAKFTPEDVEYLDELSRSGKAPH